jgi:hypothetical protein
MSRVLTMFVVSEAQAAVIRTAYEQSVEFSAAVELRQLFPGIDIAQARECVADDRELAASAQRLCRARLRAGNTTTCV